MPSPITLITSHALDGGESEANHDEQRRFAEFVAAHQPQLLEFQAYVSEDNSQLKLFFVFSDGGAETPVTTRPEPSDRDFRDSRLAGLLAGAAIIALFVAAVYLGSVGGPVPA